MNSCFLCPNCRKPLTRQEKRYVCPESHSFDVSSDGYVNLYLNVGRSGHGDGKEMILARRRFLEGGFYLPLRKAICEVLISEAPQTLLDVGCGEGYYTEGMAEALPRTTLCGIDISKDALKYAGKRLRGRVELAAASAYQLPLSDSVFQALTLIFAPFSPDECRRVLQKEGLLCMVIPGRKHLWQLKELLYERPYENQIGEYRIDGFSFEKKIPVEKEIFVEGQALQDLFAMTPYFYRTPASGKELARACTSLKTLISFEILCYRRA